MKNAASVSGADHGISADQTTGHIKYTIATNTSATKSPGTSNTVEYVVADFNRTGQVNN
jgi:hypothetical protein